MPKIRVGFAIIFFSLAIILIVMRLFYWQVIKGDTLEIAGQNQYSQKSISLASRGKIISKDNYPLAANSQAYELLVDTKSLNVSKEELPKKLSPMIFEDLNLGLTSSESASLPDEEKVKLAKDTIKSKIENSNSQWLVISEGISSESKELLTNPDLKGLFFTEKEKRYYPESSMSAQLLGFVGKDQFGSDKGYFGLEGFYDRQLKGKEGFVVEEKDVQGRPILFGNKREDLKEDGRNLILNIDRSVQFIVEEKLKEGIEKYGAKQGAVIIMDPQTGAVLSMASFPSFDPDKYYEYDKDLYRNTLVADAYEPGSTFKVLVMAAAINEGVVKPDTKCDQCSGPRQVAEYSIKTWNNQYYPNTTMTEVIQHSDNVGMIFVGEKLGKDKFTKYLNDFGFGQETKIDLEGESSPVLKKSWSSVDLATAAFGQGIAVTGVQMASAVSAIANGGKLMEPHVVNLIKESSGKTIEISPKVVKQVIKLSTAKVMTEMMINAIDNGESKFYKPKGYRIAGKTGTAQIPIRGHYDESKTVASFVGFAPADDPKFLILVILREPSSSPWGSETAAPLFFSIAKDLFTYFKIPPTN